MAAVLALDVGGTKLAAGVVDEHGSILVEARRPTVAPDGDRLLDVVSGLVDEVADRATASGVGRADLVAFGVGCGGPMTGGGESVSPLNIPQWRGFPLRARLEDHVGLPTFVDNDAKALALGEGWIGAAAGCRDYLAMVVSTGVGGGIVLDGRLLEGAAGNAGHIGHVIVDPLGRECPCGARGCLEAQVSGRSIAESTGRPADSATLPERLTVGRLVGRAVASVCNLLDLRLAVVAGSVALGFGAPFFQAAEAELSRCTGLDFSRGAQLLPAGLGGAGPLIGAAALGWRGIGVPMGSLGVDRPRGVRGSS